jgi:hypothetical protein
MHVGLVAVGGKVALLPIPLGTTDFLVHHIHAFTIHVIVLIRLKGVLFAHSSRLIYKANLGFLLSLRWVGARGNMPSILLGSCFLRFILDVQCKFGIYFSFQLENAVRCLGYTTIKFEQPKNFFGSKA